LSSERVCFFTLRPSTDHRQPDPKPCSPNPCHLVQVLEHVEVISVALGVLINLASTEPTVCSQLTAAQAAPQPAAASAARGSGGGVLSLLCRIIDATAEGVVAVAAAAPPPSAGPTSPASQNQAGGNSSISTPPSQQRTHRRRQQQQQQQQQQDEPPGCGAAPGGGADDADAHAGEAAIVEAYSAMLIGFLLRGSPRLQQLAAGLLTGGSLQPVVAAIRRCLTFYVTAGAITESTRNKLVQLLTELHPGATV